MDGVGVDSSIDAPNAPHDTEAAGARESAENRPGCNAGAETTPEGRTQAHSKLPEASEANANPAPRPWTPDRTNDDGSITIRLKRACNGCGTLLGDVANHDVDGNGDLTDVRAECPNCRPLVALETAGCKTWQILRRDLWEIDGELDELGVFTKGYTQTVDGKLRLVGLRVGEKPGHVVAFFGDTLVRHPDGRFTVHKAPAAVTA